MALFAISCAEVADPTPTQMAYGNWEVQEYYVNGQYDGSDIIERFTLERDGNFVMRDANGILTVGTWTASSTSLTLSGSDGTTYDFTIVTQTFDKMHLLQSISSPTAGTIEIRYLMDRDSNGTTYGS